MKKYIFVSIFCVVFLLLFVGWIKVRMSRLTYENKAMGVKITGPAGWYMFTEEKDSGGYIEYVEKPESFKENIVKEGTLIIFSNDPIFYETVGGANTLLYLEAKKFTSNDPPDKRTPMEVAKKYISLEEADKIKLDEEPRTITLSGKKGVTFTYTTPEAGPLPSIKETAYAFVKGDTAYIIDFLCDASVYDNLIKDVESSVNSFTLK